MTHLSFYAICIVVLVVVMYLTRSMRDEAFGMSPGTMDQLQATSIRTSIARPLPGIYQAPIFVDGFKDVNAKPDQAIEDAIQHQLTTKAITDMTTGGSFDRSYADA